MYRHIFVPLDGSRFAEWALPVALGLSRRTGADIHLATVQEPIPTFAYEEWESAATEWSQQYLANAKERASEHAGGAVTTHLLTGHVTEMLEQEADRLDADLVVMASHGRGALSRVWLGSVADSFVRHTSRPVLLLRPDNGEAPDLSEERSFTRILVPLDGTELSEAVLGYATELGALFEASYCLFRVVPYPIDVASPYLPHTVQMNQALLDEAREAANTYLTRHAEELRARGLEVDTAVEVDAQPGQSILRYAEERGCDLIAMSTHGRGGLSRAILGSAADKVLRGTRVPLLLHRRSD